MIMNKLEANNLFHPSRADCERLDAVHVDFSGIPHQQQFLASKPTEQLKSCTESGGNFLAVCGPGAGASCCCNVQTVGLEIHINKLCCQTMGFCNPNELLTIVYGIHRVN